MVDRHSFGGVMRDFGGEIVIWSFTWCVAPAG